MKTNKKATISATMIVTVTLLIASFAVILLIYGSVDWSGQSDKEICHESVLLRGTLPGLGIKEISSLQCKTEKICIRGDKFLGKGDCNEDFGELKEVKYTNVNSLEGVEKTIADSVVDCWSMMGKGELPLYSEGWASFGFGGVTSNCVICSRIAFDTKTLEEKGIDVSKRDVLNYMLKNKIPNQDKTYYGVLTEGKALVKDTSISKVEITDPNTGEKTVVDLTDFNELDPEETGKEELAVLYMQISAPSGSDVLKNNLKVLFGGAVVAGPASVGIGKKVVSACTKAPVICLVVGLVIDGVQQGVTIHNRGVAATHCGDVSVGDTVRDGCSVVRTVNYNIEEIQQYCGAIESIP